MSDVEQVYHLQRFPHQKKAAVYCRISTSRSRQENSLENQISGLVGYVSRHPEMRLVAVYTDVGSGRLAESRKELQRLIAACDGGDVDLIVAKSMSRFGRNTADVIKICRHLKAKKVDVYFLTENIHSLNPDAELSISLSAAIAEGESYTRSENVKWGLAKSAQNPDSALYNRRCYGYQVVDDRLVIDEQEAAVIRQIFDSYLSGMGTYAITKMLADEDIPSPTGKESWSKNAIEKILRNEKYCGDVVFYKTYLTEYPSSERKTNIGQHEQKVIRDHHPAIIEREMFEKVKAAIRGRSRKKDPQDQTY